MKTAMASKTTLLATAVVAIVILGGVGAYLLLKGEDTGEIVIYVKDEAADWKYMNVTFSAISVHKADADSDNNTAANATEEGGEWIDVPLEQQTIDLRAYVDVSALLAAGNISTGRYTQVRIVVDSVEGTTADGTAVTFKVGSDDQVSSNEFKIITMFDIVEGETTKLTVDIDLDASIVHSPSGEWIFTLKVGEITEG